MGLGPVGELKDLSMESSSLIILNLVYSKYYFVLESAVVMSKRESRRAGACGPFFQEMMGKGAQTSEVQCKRTALGLSIFRFR